MRKLTAIIAIAFLLQACSVSDFLPASPPTNTVPPSATVTKTPTRTLTPTRTTTPTPPSTATLIIEVPSNTPFVFAGAAFPTAAFTPTSSVPLGGFESVHVSNGRMYYGVCQPNYTKMTVKVEHPDEIKKVYLFFRLESAKKIGDYTPWTGTITDNDGEGVFIYTLFANNIPERRSHLKAYVQYQFVAEDENKKIVGRTSIYTRNIILEPCR